jgi:hypothetical protein
MKNITEFYTIIGRFEDSGDTMAMTIERHEKNEDPHMAALQYMASLSDLRQFEIIALLEGRCNVLVTQQSLSIFMNRIINNE